MSSKRFKKIISLVLVLSMVLSVSVFSFAEGTDIENHWAKNEIEYLLNKKIVSGYSDGNFKPDQSITRAEFFKVINGVFGYSEKAEISFKDVNAEDWFFDDVAKAVAAGYVNGYEDGTMKPNKPITRQEVAKIIAVAFGLQNQSSNSAYSFKDESSIENWAINYVGIMKDKGFITGYSDGTFGPKKNITRGEVAKIISNASGEIVNTAGEYNKGAKGNLIVNVPGVVLKNMTIEGDLYLAEGIEKGDVTLDRVNVKGQVFVRGGGENSIHIANSKIKNMVIVKTSDNVRVVFGENVEVENIEVDENSIVVVEKGAKINNLKIVGQAKIEIAKGAEVKALEVVSKNVEIKSEGTIGKLVAKEEVKVNGTVVKKGAEVKVEAGKIKDTKNDGTTTTPSGGGGGGGSSSGGTISVSAISVTPKTMTLKVGATGTITATVEPTNATNKKVNWTTSDGKIATVDENGEVTAVAVGTATITATTEDGGKTATCNVTVEDKQSEVDKAELEAVIGEAEGKVEKAVIGTEVGNYPQTAVDELKTAIETAKSVLNNAEATQEQVDSAVAALNEAILTFEKSVVRAPNTHVVTLSSNPTNGGKVTVTSEVYGEKENATVINAVYGEEITVKAIPETGYEFIKWAGTFESEDNPYTFTMPDKDVDLIANFEAVKPEEPTLKDIASKAWERIKNVTWGDPKYAELEAGVANKTLNINITDNTAKLSRVIFGEDLNDADITKRMGDATKYSNEIKALAEAVANCGATDFEVGSIKVNIAESENLPFAIVNAVYQNQKVEGKTPQDYTLEDMAGKNVGVNIYVGEKALGTLTFNFVDKTPIEEYSFDKIKFTISSGNTTCFASVGNNYVAKAVIPKGAKVDASEAILKLEMTDVDSLGIVETRSHELTIKTGVEISGIDLNSWIQGLLSLETATIKGKFGEKEVVYNIVRQDDGNSYVWVATPNTTQAAREAWQYVVSAVEAQTHDVDDSQIFVPQGAYLIIGNDKLEFTSNLELTDVTGDLAATENKIREAVTLSKDTESGSQIAIYMPKTAKLRVGQSEAILNKDVEIKIKGFDISKIVGDNNSFMFDTILEYAQGQEGVVNIIKGSLDILNAFAKGMNDQNINVEYTNIDPAQ